MTAATSAASDHATTARELRRAIRQGRHGGLTTGHAPGHVQANLVILPAHDAQSLVDFCTLNQRACPILGVSATGSPHMPALGQDLDVRTDAPGYIVHRHAQAPENVSHITSLWRDDLVCVAIGCWFSLEDALAAAGVRLRHVELGIQGPLFRSVWKTQRAGMLGDSPLVVSMRPFARADIPAVRAITSRFPRVHGAPLYEGDPAALGIRDIAAPDFGEAMTILPDEVALFWGCGLTAQVALEAADVPFFITHAPGKMLATDLRNADLADGSDTPSHHTTHEAPS